MLRILVFLVIFFALEIFILLQISVYGGSWLIFLIVLGTALVGCILVRRQGTTVLNTLKHEIFAVISGHAFQSRKNFYTRLATNPKEFLHSLGD